MWYILLYNFAGSGPSGSRLTYRTRCGPSWLMRVTPRSLIPVVISSRKTKSDVISSSLKPQVRGKLTINDSRATSLAPDTIRVQESTSQANSASTKAKRLNHICSSRDPTVEINLKLGIPHEIRARLIELAQDFHRRRCTDKNPQSTIFSRTSRAELTSRVNVRRGWREQCPGHHESTPSRRPRRTGCL